MLSFHEKSPTHLAYADETQHNIGRYRGLAVITIGLKDAIILNEQLQHIFYESSIAEFKWSKLHSARERFAAVKILECILDFAVQNIIRIDVLSWDTSDSRHAITGRSDIRNIRRMYYFLFRNVLSKRWPNTAVWHIYPDEQSAEPWLHLNYLQEIVDWHTYESIVEINVGAIRPSRSHDEPLIQLADMFAGLAVYSRSSYDKYEYWLANPENKPVPYDEGFQLSNADRERCFILSKLDEFCKRYTMGVSLKKMRGLRTFNPQKPINFWWYEPQIEDDRAPIWK